MPRFSIVVTTCDRPSLLAGAIRAVLAVNVDDFELIVSDNFSQPSAREIVAGFADPRIRYLRTDRRLAMPDHWEFVWEHVRGDFVLYLGDDNALHPDILAYADRAIAAHDLELVSWRVCSYFHPDWNIRYGDFPSHGNVLAFDPGTTGLLYRCAPGRVLEQYCESLRCPPCFPVMLNCLVSRAAVDRVRSRIGRIFWACNPDISLTYLLLGTIKPDGFAMLDAYGAIGGRSSQSVLASMLSQGEKSRRVYDVIDEFGDNDILPHHPIKFIAMSNSLACPISQGLALMPDEFAPYRWSARTLALRTIDDIYVSRIVPWADDPKFVGQLEAFFDTLPPDVRQEVQAYRARCAEQAAAARAAEAQPSTPAPERHGIWASGLTYYVDMTLLRGADVADAAQRLDRVFDLLDRADTRFVDQNRGDGVFGDALSDAAWRSGSRDAR